MATPVIMPKFGMAQEDGTILRWLKNEGEHIQRGETLLEVQTDKVDMEVEAPATGVLRDVRYGVDATVPVTTVIAMIADEAEEARIGALEAPALSQPASEAKHGPAEAAPVSVPDAADKRVTPVARRVAEAEGIDLAGVQGTGKEGRVTRADVERASHDERVSHEERAAHDASASQEVHQEARVAATPAARRLAREAGIDLAKVPGSGPGGRVQAEDVTTVLPTASAAQPALSAPQKAAPATAETLRGKRRTIATRLSQSWQAAPHIFLTTRIDMTRAEAIGTSLASDVEARGGKLTVTILLARAVTAALQRWPRLNAWLRSEGDDLVLEVLPRVNLGIAVALDDGLIVPVIAGAESLGLAGLAARVADLSKRARSNSLAPDEVTSGTFSISNLGMYPIEHFTAIINPPQVAILACGQIQMEPVWDGTQFHPRPVIHLTLSADHRAVDGAMAAAFLAEVKANLETPERLLL